MHQHVAPITELDTYFARLFEHHPRLCPRQVLGVRMGLHAADLLEVDDPVRDRHLLAIVETDGCFADAVSVATGCWLGRRSLRLVDHGKVAVTVLDVLTERAVRLRPHPLARARATAYAPTADTRWQAQLQAYQVMPADDLLCAERVQLRGPVATLLGRPGQRAKCAGCGEEVINLRQVVESGRSVCRGCAGDRYYAAPGRAAAAA